MDTDLTDRGVVHRVPDAGRAAHKAKVMPRMDRVPRVHKHSVELVLDWLRGRSCRGDREVLGNVEGLGEANRPADLLLSGGAKKIKALELETEDIGGLVDREPLDRIDLCTTPARKDKFWGGLLDKKKKPAAVVLVVAFQPLGLGEAVERLCDRVGVQNIEGKIEEGVKSVGAEFA